MTYEHHTLSEATTRLKPTRQPHWLHAFAPSVVVVGSVLVASLTVPTATSAQIWRSQEGRYRTPMRTGLPKYTSSFMFCRLWYDATRSMRSGLGWSTDYPAADNNFMTRFEELTPTYIEHWENGDPGIAAVRATDPDIFRCPFLFMTDPGSVTFSGAEIEGLRDYLLKGGFLILDDFEANQWYNMDAQLLRALPEREWVELDDTHSIFGTFFYVEDIYVPHPLVDVEPRYMSIFEDNDPRKRVMVLANHNSDLAEYWEWSASGLFAVDPTNDAYRLGVNYIIYALTH